MKALIAVLASTALLATSCKKSDPAAAAAGSAAPGAVAAPGSFAGFEGDVTLLAKSAKERRAIPPITLTVKGTSMRFDIPEGVEGAPKLGQHTYAIVDVAHKKLYAVVDEQKMVMVMDSDCLGEQFKKMRPHGAAAEPSNAAPPKVTKTGHMDTVAGMSCEDWDITTQKNERGRVCVSGESAPWLQMPSIGLPSESLWSHELFDGQHLPLRMIGYDSAGTEENSLEVSKLERKPVPDSTFAVPAGYRTMDFGAMMAGMQGMLSGMTGGMAQTPGGAPSGMPAFALPPGVTLPQGLKLPKDAAEAMKELEARAKAAGLQRPAK